MYNLSQFSALKSNLFKMGETNPVYAPFFGVMGATAAVAFSGELLILSFFLLLYFYFQSSLFVIISYYIILSELTLSLCVLLPI